MKVFNVILLLGIFVFMNPSGRVYGSEFLLFYLGGQSNMDGYGMVNELPENLRKPVKDVYIFHGNPSPDLKDKGGAGMWTQLKPGHGAGYSFNSLSGSIKYSQRFGPEITFAHHLKKQFPNKKIAFIKYSRGGTSIHVEAARNFGCWDPDFDKGEGKARGINQYDHFLETVINATSVDDIDGDGSKDRLVPAGIIWMQGESDASINEDIANEYKAQLHKLMIGIQAAFRSDDLPVVIGRISDSGRGSGPDKKTWIHGDIVRNQMADYVASYPPAAMVITTDSYGYSDPWHYDTAGYIDLGKQFAVEMIRLIEDR